MSSDRWNRYMRCEFDECGVQEFCILGDLKFEVCARHRVLLPYVSGFINLPMLAGLPAGFYSLTEKVLQINITENRKGLTV